MNVNLVEGSKGDVIFFYRRIVRFWEILRYED